MIRLVINAIGIAPGGGLSVLLGLLAGWREIGAELEITVLAARPATQQALRDNGWGDILREVHAENGFARQWWQRITLPGLLRELNADLLLSNNYYVSGTPCPQVIHHQTLWALFAIPLWPYIRRGPRRYLQTLGARKALRAADANVYISTYMRDCAELICPGSRPRNHVVYNGLNREFLEFAKSPVAESRRPASLCAVQAPSTYKDNESLLKALAELVRLAPEQDWRLRIVGTGNWDAWRRRAEGLEVADRVEFLGHMDIDKIGQLLTESSCLIYPSVFEGFGMPIIEAMACGCPVVAVDDTAVSEIAATAAVLVPPRSPGEIAKSVLRLHQDDQWRRDIITRGRKRASDFSWTKSAESFCRIFKSVLNSQ